jgi:hypothetical protein
MTKNQALQRMIWTIQRCKTSDHLLGAEKYLRLMQNHNMLNIESVYYLIGEVLPVVRQRIHDQERVV